MLKWLVTSLAFYFAVQWVRSTMARGAKRRAMGARDPARIDSKRPAAPKRAAAVKRLPHEILGVPEDAPIEVIQARYRKLAVQYHPDKLASSATELQDLAGERLREINGAYGEIMKQRRER